MQQILNVLALFARSQKFIFVYDDASIEETVREIWAKASQPECELNWFDAIVLVKRLRSRAIQATEDYEE